MRDAKTAGLATQLLAERIAAKHGAIVSPLNLKSEASIARKLKEAPNKPVKDGARTTIIVSQDKVADVVSTLKRHPATTEYKEHTPKNNAGYSGHLININVKGVTTEIQVNTPEMIYAKEPLSTALKILGKKECERIYRATGQYAGWGHRYYEELRSNRTDNPKRRKGDVAKVDSRNYYDSFRKK